MANTQAIDHVLHQAAQANDVPGVVAMAATDQGVVYEGAFGRRELGKDPAMTPDTVVWIASMTKAITSAAAMQLVERGQLQLDVPAADVVPELAQAQVIEGFDASGIPQLRAPRRAITLKHLLTHTAGFSHEMFSADIGQYQTATGTPGITTCENAALTTPLLCDPGERWEYGINIDWVGKIVEAVSGQKLGDYLQHNFFAPLGMHSTSFKLSPSQRARLASVHRRGPDEALAVLPFEIPQEPQFQMGGGGGCIAPRPTTCASPGCSCIAARSPATRYCSPRPCTRWPRTTSATCTAWGAGIPNGVDHSCLRCCASCMSRVCAASYVPKVLSWSGMGR